MLLIFLTMVVIPVMECLHEEELFRIRHRIDKGQQQTYVFYDRDSRLKDVKSWCDLKNGSLPVLRSQDDINFLLTNSISKGNVSSSTWIHESSMTFLRSKDILWKNESSNAIKCSVCLFVYKSCCGIVLKTDGLDFETTVECRDCKSEARMACVFERDFETYEARDLTFEETETDLYNRTVVVRPASEDIRNIIIFLLIFVALFQLTACLVCRARKLQMMSQAVQLSDTEVGETTSPATPIRRPVSLDIRRNYDNDNNYRTEPSRQTDAPLMILSHHGEDEDKPPAYEDVVGRSDIDSKP